MVDHRTLQRPEEAQVTTDVEEQAAPPKSRRRWPWVVGGLAILVVIGAVLIVNANGESDDVVETAPVNTGEVVVTDLVEVTTYSATLGRVAGDPIASSLPGTVTEATEPGDLVVEGDVLFSVDDNPVVLLYGDTPAFRAIAPSDDTLTVTSRTNGTLTSVTDEGEVLVQGDVAYIVGDEPTFVLYGDTPIWRTLEEGIDEGPDVQQLEQALTDLGYDPDETITIDEDFTANTESLVERWQEDVGIEEDGVVDLGEVVFISGPGEVQAVLAGVGVVVTDGAPILEIGDGVPNSGRDVEQLETSLVALGFDPGPADGIYDNRTRRAVVAWQESVGASADAIVDLGEVVFSADAIRISEQLATVGTTVTAGAPVLAATGSQIVVTLDLPAEDQGLVTEGDAVVIELPDNSETPGTVETIDTVASVSAEGLAVFEVTIVLDEPDAASGLDEAPVDVDIVTDRVDAVVAVPVTALVALAEGGYAVEVTDGTATRLVAVDPGFYADGLVEIESAGIAVGDEVVLP